MQCETEKREVETQKMEERMTAGKEVRQLSVQDGVFIEFFG